MPGFDLYGLLVENSDRSWSYNINGNQKLQDGLEKVQGLWGMSAAYAGSQAEAFNSFVNKRSLFLIEILWRNQAQNTQLRNTKDYSILPMPKYDEGQGGYYTSPQDAYSALSLMNHMPDRIEMVSAVLDLLCSRSYADVRPFYVEKIVKTRYVSDSVEVEIMNQILNGVIYETAIVYGNQLEMPAYMAWRFRVMFGGSVGQMWAENDTTFNKNLENVTDWYYARSN